MSAAGELSRLDAAGHQRRLIIITGAEGAGKSTTIAHCCRAHRGPPSWTAKTLGRSTRATLMPRFSTCCAATPPRWQATSGTRGMPMSSRAASSATTRTTAPSELCCRARPTCSSLNCWPPSRSAISAASRGQSTPASSGETSPTRPSTRTRRNERRAAGYRYIGIETTRLTVAQTVTLIEEAIPEIYRPLPPAGLS